MPGQKFLQTVIQRMEALADEHGYADGEEWFFERVADGAAMKDIADDLGCSRPFLYVWLKKGGPDEKARKHGLLAEARRRSADAHLEDGQRILDDEADKTVVTSPEVALATQRAGYRRSMAEMRDPDRFGKRSGVQINVSANELHLDALRARGRVELPAGQPEVIEAEVVAEDEGEDDVLAELAG